MDPLILAMYAIAAHPEDDGQTEADDAYVLAYLSIDTGDVDEVNATAEWLAEVRTLLAASDVRVYDGGNNELGVVGMRVIHPDGRVWWLRADGGGDPEETGTGAPPWEDDSAWVDESTPLQKAGCNRCQYVWIGLTMCPVCGQPPTHST